jgi:hypothetical protein
MNYTEEDLLQSLKSFYILNNRAPTVRDFRGNPDYPNSNTIASKFGSWNNALILAGLKTNNSPGIPYYDCTEEGIIKAIQNFVEKYDILPTSKQFINSDGKYPSNHSVRRIFSTWNAAIEAAGFTPNIQNGYGVDTYGLDKHLYRSQAEAYFVDNYLYKKYKYIIEPKYPEPYNRYYDWYIPSLDLYIELDGEIRPNIILEKIAINKLLNNRCLFIKTADIKHHTYINNLFL